MKLPSGLEIDEPRALLRGFAKDWYPMYDGVFAAKDNCLHVNDIAISMMLNSRISGNTGGLIYQNKESVEEALAMVPTDLDLLDVPKGDDIPGAQGISRAVSAMCALARVKLSVSTKILHKKRPALISIFDSIVEGQYHPLHVPSVRGRSWGDYALALTRAFHNDMLAVASELRDAAAELQENGTPLTPCRILNVLIWIVKSGSGNEERIRRLGES